MRMVTSGSDSAGASSGLSWVTLVVLTNTRSGAAASPAASGASIVVKTVRQVAVK